MGKPSRRCIVPGCNSTGEEKDFRQEVTKNGHALCPVHNRDSADCTCSSSTKPLYSLYSFPKSPGVKRTWFDLLNLRENFQPSAYHCVCSKHFDINTRGISQKQKLPTLDIGRNQSEIRQILHHHVSSVIEKHAIIGVSSPANKATNARLAETTLSAIASLDAAQANFDRQNRQNRKGKYDESIYENFGDALEIAKKSVLTGPTTGASSQESTGDTAGAMSTSMEALAQGILNVSMEDEEGEETPVIRRRKPPPAASPTRLRPQSMDEMQVRQATATPSVEIRGRRPHSAIISATAYQTPSPGGKRTCEQDTPDYGMTTCLDCIVKETEISALKEELKTVRQQLNESRTVRIQLESRRCTSCDQKDRKINEISAKNRALHARIGRMKKPEKRVIVQMRTEIDFNVDEMHEGTFMALFGIRKKAFKLMFEKLEPVARAATYWKGTSSTRQKQKPTPPNIKSSNVYMHEFLLFLMRLRLKPNVQLLAFIFDLSLGQVSQVFNTWLDIFSRHFDWMIQLPDQVACRRLAPPHIAAMFPRLRCIGDCTEVFMQTPQSAVDQVATYSHYKKHNTVKVYVANLPNGCIGYLSSPWGGRTSDNYIFYHCGFLEKLKSGDQVLADRGFTVGDELMRRGIELNIPPAATGVAQFPIEDVIATKRIANVRIHVERSIGRMKVYKILNGVLPVTTLPGVDKIFKSVAILVNLQDEIVR